MKWIKHDTDAHRDPKIRKLIAKHGASAYGVYWTVLEMIAANVTSENMTFELEEDAEMIAMDLRMEPEEVTEIIASMVAFKLFDRAQSKAPRALKILARIDSSMQNSPKFRDALVQAKERLLGVTAVPKNTGKRRAK